MDLNILGHLLISHWHIIVLFFMIAVLYSSIGFGGGSSYLALLALTSMAFTQIRSISLLCNIVVVGGNVWLFYKQKHYHWKKVLSLVLWSIPMAFVGGYLSISQNFFFILLGATLFFAAGTLWFSKKIISTHASPTHLHVLKNASYGGIIGFISGMVGIGGGIFLAPLLHFIHWDTPKKIAATASLFILLNSISGLLGQSFNNSFSLDAPLSIVLVLSVSMGGFIGSRIGHRLLTPIQLKKGTAILIAYVGLRILIKSFFDF